MLPLDDVYILQLLSAAAATRFFPLLSDAIDIQPVAVGVDEFVQVLPSISP